MTFAEAAAEVARWLELECKPFNCETWVLRSGLSENGAQRLTFTVTGRVEDRMASINKSVGYDDTEKAPAARIQLEVRVAYGELRELIGRKARTLAEYRTLAAIAKEDRDPEQRRRLKRLAVEMLAKESCQEPENETSRLLKDLMAKYSL